VRMLVPIRDRIAEEATVATELRGAGDADV
jgi:hypothetical protein